MIHLKIGDVVAHPDSGCKITVKDYFCFSYKINKYIFVQYQWFEKSILMSDTFDYDKLVIWEDCKSQIRNIIIDKLLND